MKRMLSIFSALACTLLLSIQPVFADLPSAQQEQTLWCWAAVDKSLIASKGNTLPTQCQIVKSVKGTSSCANVTASMSEALSGLTLYGLAGTYYSGALSFTNVQNYSASGFIIGWRWLDSNGNTLGGHIVGGEGYSETLTGGGYPTQYVKYMDPGDGTHKWIIYSNAVGASSGYDRQWMEGVKNIYKPPV